MHCLQAMSNGQKSVVTTMFQYLYWMYVGSKIHLILGDPFINLTVTFGL